MLIITTAAAGERELHPFDRVQLTDIYYSEGVNAADIDNDGNIDAIYGPFWFAGPHFKTKRLIYKTFPQPREAYANHFFAWTYDFNGEAGIGRQVIIKGVNGDKLPTSSLAA